MQSRVFASLDSVTVCLIATELIAGIPMLRVGVKPTAGDRLIADSQVQIDKIVTVPVSKVIRKIGALEADTIRNVSGAIAFFLDFD